MSSLFVIKGRDKNRKFGLSGEIARDDTIQMGRDNENEIVINDAEVSRQHAEIKILNDGQFELHDLGSSNGTFVNDHRIKSHQLQNGDRVQMGRTTFMFTSTNTPRELDRSDLVRIVQNPLPESASKIVSSMVADGTESARQLLAGPSDRLESNGLELVYQTALAVSQTLDIDQLLDKLMGIIFSAIKPDRGCILLYDSESQQMIPRISRSNLGLIQTGQIEISRTIVDYVIEQQEGVLTSDAVNDNRWDSEAKSIVNMGVSEAICVPMQGRYDTHGVIYVDTRTPPGKLADLRVASKLNTEHLKLMIAIGHQAALAIEDTNFYSAMIQSERMAAMGHTIAMLSHHIKNILQGINGGSYLVKSGIAEQEIDVIQSGWKIVEKNQAKISQLVMDMLSFSKEREPDMELGDLNATVTDVVELMIHRACENEVELQFAPDDNLPDCYFDAEAIHRAALNVISNAIDAFEEDDQGKVNIRTLWNKTDQKVEIWVEDNGAGIDEEFLPKIFGVFESGKGQRGTGLGLPVSKKIMQEHGGDIVVESQLGQGSQFCLSFPLQTSMTHGQTVEIPREEL